MSDPGGGQAGAPEVPASRAHPLSRFGARNAEARWRAAGMTLTYGSGPAAPAPARLGPSEVHIGERGQFGRRAAADRRFGILDSAVAGEWSAGDLAAALGVLYPVRGARDPRPTLPRIAAPQFPWRDLAARPSLYRPGVEFWDPQLVSVYADASLTTEYAAFASSPKFSRRVDGRALVQWQGPTVPPRTRDLLAAQDRRLDSILDTAGLAGGARVLVIDNDWGHTATYLAERGLTVWVAAASGAQAAALAGNPAITVLTPEQLKAQARPVPLDAAIVSGRSELWLPGYTALTIHSLRRWVAPGGTLVLDTPIDSLTHKGWHRQALAWTRARVWPTLWPPSYEGLTRVIDASLSGFTVTEQWLVGPMVAATYNLWRQRYAAREEIAAARGFSPEFRRLWSIHLALMEHAYGAGGLEQLVTFATRR